VFVVVVVYFIIDIVWKLLETPSYVQLMLFILRVHVLKWYCLNINFTKSWHDFGRRCGSRRDSWYTVSFILMDCMWYQF